MSKLLERIPIFPTFVVVSLCLGLSIPAFYEWTGSEQSRPSPLIGQTAIGMLLSALVVWITLPWWPVPKDPAHVEGDRKFQFNIRMMLIITAVVAAILAIVPRSSLLILGNGLLACAMFDAVRRWIGYPGFRWRMTALFACMYFPFTWILNPDELSNFSFDFFWAAIGLPAFIPNLFVARLVQQHPEELAGVSSILVAIELSFGCWLMRQGPRWSIAFLLFVLIMSVFGSFILNALLRM